LSNAKLIGADLQYADLRGIPGSTILQFSDLSRANLSNADLKFADLTPKGARLPLVNSQLPHSLQKPGKSFVNEREALFSN